MPAAHGSELKRPHVIFRSRSSKHLILHYYKSFRQKIIWVQDPGTADHRGYKEQRIPLSNCPPEPSLSNEILPPVQTRYKNHTIGRQKSADKILYMSRANAFGYDSHQIISKTCIKKIKTWPCGLLISGYRKNRLPSFQGAHRHTHFQIEKSEKWHTRYHKHRCGGKCRLHMDQSWNDLMWFSDRDHRNIWYFTTTRTFVRK